MTKILHIDIETTSSNTSAAGIHQLAIIAEIDGVVKEPWVFSVRPIPGSAYHKDSLAVSGVTMQQIQKYPLADVVFDAVMTIIKSHLNLQDPKDKWTLQGYRVSAFDEPIFKRWFSHMSSDYSKFFHSMVKDSFVLAGEYLEFNNIPVTSFSLKTVAKALGIEVVESSLHDAGYDAELSRQIYNIVKPKY